MDLCTSYPNNIECVLQLNNEFNLKVIILCSLLLYSLVLFLYHYKVNPEKQYYSVWLHYMLKILPPVYIVSFIPLLLTLKHSIGIDIFILIVVGIGFLVLVSMLGSALLYGVSKTLEIYGVNWTFEQRSGDDKKYKKTKEKHGKD